MNFGDTQVECYEVRRTIVTSQAPSSSSLFLSQSSSSATKINDINTKKESELLSSITLSDPKDFICLDFTVDLDVAWNRKGPRSTPHILIDIIIFSKSQRIISLTALFLFLISIVISITYQYLTSYHIISFITTLTDRVSCIHIN